MYRAFLKATNKVLPNTLRKRHYLRRRIRRQFETFRKETDPNKQLEWEHRANNTLALLQIASQRRGIENDIIKNLAENEYRQSVFKEKPPFARQKLKPDIRDLHKHADDNFESVIDLLNKELDLCL